MAVIRALAVVLVFGIVCGFLVAQVDELLGAMFAATTIAGVAAVLALLAITRYGSAGGDRSHV